MVQNRHIWPGLSERKAWQPRLRGDRGSTLVETAFSISILLTLLVGIMWCGLMVYSYHFISNAAREGARYAIVRGSTWYQAPWSNKSGTTCASFTDSACTATKTNISDYVKSLAFPGIDTSQIQVNSKWYSFPGGTNDDKLNAAGDFVQVQVVYTFPIYIPFLPNKSITMSSTSMMTIAQ